MFCLYFSPSFIDSRDTPTVEVNDSAAAILSMVPPVFHKFLTTKRKNNTIGTFSQLPLW
jgi:hypothetical protein